MIICKIAAEFVIFYDNFRYSNKMRNILADSMRICNILYEVNREAAPSAGKIFFCRSSVCRAAVA